MKKAIGQTVRDLKRGVNKKVLKVPSIEQKVLDATSNEAWGPHGSVLADIAQATKNYHEYQMIMAVIWKRINDTGKNWRHVYKALTVLEYLVAHGSERVIDDIREHGYQISTLSDFQYIDSSGRDQGNNIRKKSQSLVVLVNDKERLQEVRQKAAANRDKYRTTTVGGMYRPGSGSYGDKYDDDRYDGRYGNRDDDRNGYGRDRDWASRDDDKARYGDSYGQEGDRYGRYGEDRSSRGGYKDDDYRGRSQSIGDYNYGSRSRSADGERYGRNEDDEQHSSRGSGARADEHSQDGRLDHKYSEQSLGAPPSYEEAVSAGQSPTYSERDRESSVSQAPKASSPTAASPSYTATAAPAPVGPASPLAAPVSPSKSLAQPQPTGQDSNNMEEFGFDEFDPRGASLVTPTTSLAPASSAVEVDLLGSLSESFSSNALALVTTSTEDDTTVAFNSESTNVAAPLASTVNNQSFDDPFGDGPFKAISSTDTIPVQQHITTSTDFTSSFAAAPQSAFGVEPTNIQSRQSSGIEDIDILADILPPSAPSSSSFNPQNGHNVPPQPMSHGSFAPQTNQPPPPQFGLPFQGNSFQPQPNLPGSGFPAQPGQHFLQTNPLQSAESNPQTGFTSQTMALTFPVQAVQASQPALSTQGGFVQSNHQANLNFYGNYNAQPVTGGGPPPSGFSAVPPMSGGPFLQQNSLSQPGLANYMPLHVGSQVPQVQPISSGISTISTTPASASTRPVSQLSKEKFEMKSSVWADTLSRGLVDLNISGHKTNPLADIGVDFDAINRKEKRMEKPSTTSTTTPTSTITMGKAMGSGSGLGRAGASALAAPPNPMMGSANMGMGMGMGGYGVGQPMGRGMGPGMDMNMGTGQGFNMQQQSGFRPGHPMPGNPYYGQQPYGGGYR